MSRFLLAATEHCEAYSWLHPSFWAVLLPVLAVQNALQLSLLKLDPCWHQAICWLRAQVPSRAPPVQAGSVNIRSPCLHQFCITSVQFSPPFRALWHSAPPSFLAQQAAPQASYLPPGTAPFMTSKFSVSYPKLATTLLLLTAPVTDVNRCEPSAMLWRFLPMSLPQHAVPFNPTSRVPSPQLPPPQVGARHTPPKPSRFT